MTSVLNLQRLSSGSRLVILGAFFLFLSGCGIFSPKGNSNNGKDPVVLTDPKGGMDTLYTDPIPSSERPPITAETAPEVEEDPFAAFKKESYNITMFIPFSSEEYDYVNPDNNDPRFVHYYAGVKMALNELEAEGSKLRVKVVDSKRDPKKVTDMILNGALSDEDIIIGPYSRDGLKAVADYGKKNKKAIISPWLASSRIAQANPYYVQLRPITSSHYFKLIEHAVKNYDPSEILLVGRDVKNDLNRFRYFQRTFAALNNTTQKLEEFIVSEDSLSYGETAFDSLFVNGGKRAIILPNWNYNDEDFIYACLRKLNVEKGMTDIAVYGMPIMFDSEKMEFDFYKNLNIRVAISEFVDWDSRKVKDFTQKYFNAFGELPSKDAFEGYDMTRFIAGNLMKYGLNFQHHLENDKTTYLQTAYDIQRVYEDGDEKFENIKYLENKHLNLIQLVDNKFEKID